jgi:hypothetical protein
MLQDTTLLRNAAGFGAGAALAGDPAARASILKSSFIENEATGGVGEGTDLTAPRGKQQRAAANSTLRQAIHANIACIQLACGGSCSDPKPIPDATLCATAAHS